MVTKEESTNAICWMLLALVAGVLVQTIVQVALCFEILSELDWIIRSLEAVVLELCKVNGGACG
jgi:hypothetical protein